MWHNLVLLPGSSDVKEGFQGWGFTVMETKERWQIHIDRVKFKKIQIFQNIYRSLIIRVSLMNTYWTECTCTSFMLNIQKKELKCTKRDVIYLERHICEPHGSTDRYQHKDCTGVLSWQPKSTLSVSIYNIHPSSSSTQYWAVSTVLVSLEEELFIKVPVVVTDSSVKVFLCRTIQKKLENLFNLNCKVDVFLLGDNITQYKQNRRNQYKIISIQNKGSFISFSQLRLSPKGSWKS